MTRIILKTLIIIILMIRCNAAQPISDENCSVENLECAEDLTQIAEYPYGHTEFIANFQGLTVDKGFQVVVDSQFKVKVQNFISPLETHFRKKIQELDALLGFDTYKGLKTVSAAQKRKSILQERNWCQKRADSLHFANNRGQQQVLLINNSNDTVYLSLRDWSFRVMLQALTKEGCWKPIQGSEPVYCPTMEAPYKIIPPKMANRFITALPNKGDFKTKFRYKILSEVCFYYSKEFEGSINYCAFAENTKQNIDKLDYEVDSKGRFRPRVTDKKSLKTRLKETMERMERFLED